MPFGFHSLFGDRPSRSDVTLSANRASSEYPSEEIIDNQAEQEESRAVTRRVGRLLKGGAAAKSSTSRCRWKGTVSRKAKRGKTRQKKGRPGTKGRKQRKPAKKTKKKKKAKQTRGKSTLSKQAIEKIIRSLSANRQKPKKPAIRCRRR